ncbi:MAG: hypothetical protein ACTFAK_00605 [Candidatus Electronema sp. VV]
MFDIVQRVALLCESVEQDWQQRIFAILNPFKVKKITEDNMKRSISTLIVVASLMISNHGSAEEIKDIFGISLGEKLETSSFTKVADDAPPPFHPWSYGYTYVKSYKHDIFKRIEVFVDIDGIVLSVSAISDFMDYKLCKPEGAALVKKLSEKYRNGTLSTSGVFHFKNTGMFDAGRVASGGCTGSDDKNFIYYSIEDEKLEKEARRKMEKIEMQQVKEKEEKYKGL